MKNLSTSYAEFVFQDFKSYRRTRGISEDDIKMNLKQQNSNFIPYDIPPGIYSITDILYYLERVSKRGHQIKDVDISKKLDLSVLCTLMFDEKCFQFPLVTFLPFCDYRGAWPPMKPVAKKLQA